MTNGYNQVKKIFQLEPVNNFTIKAKSRLIFNFNTITNYSRIYFMTINQSTKYNPINWTILKTANSKILKFSFSVKKNNPILCLSQHLHKQKTLSVHHMSKFYIA